jgi:hypothetical protein
MTRFYHHLKRNIVRYIGFLSVMLFSNLYSQSVIKDSIRVFKNKTDNNKCLKCHAHRVYQIYNEDSSRLFRERMCCNFVIDTMIYYNSNHWNLKCMDCHSEEYLKTPHNSKLRFQVMPSCMD